MSGEEKEKPTQEGEVQKVKIGDKEFTEAELQEQLAKAASAGKSVLNVSGQEVEFTKEQLEEALTKTSQMSSYIQYLQSEGVIDAQGNIVSKVGKTKTKEERGKGKGEEEEDDGESKVKELEAKIAKLERSQQSEASLKQINSQLSALGRQHADTRDDEELKNDIEQAVLVKWYLNPNINVPAAYATELKKITGRVEKKHKQYLDEKMKQSEQKGERPGGSSGVSIDKPFTADDLRKGTIAEALRKRLLAAGEV
jgi:hypothetical protein